MYPKKLAELIDNCLDAPNIAPPLYVWGPPGIGKSQIVKGQAKKRHIGWVDNRPLLHDPTDYRGLLVVIGNHAEWVSPSELPTDNFCMGCNLVLHEHSMVATGVRIEATDGTVTGVKCKRCGSSDIVWKGLFMADEVSSAPPMTQASLYQLFLDRKIGEYQFPKGWFMVAASNRIEDRAVVFRTSSALSNRFTHIDLELSLDDWVDWAFDNKIDPDIIGFLKWRGIELLFNFDPKSSDKAFTTPRTWEKTSILMGIVRSNSILHEAMGGTLGKGTATEFLAFLKIRKELPDLMPILQGTSNYAPPQNRIDLKYAIVSALVSQADPKKHFDNLLKWSKNISEEFAALLVRMMVSKERQMVQTAPSFKSWALAHSDVILGSSK
jgi:hypothetical protein